MGASAVGRVCFLCDELCFALLSDPCRLQFLISTHHKAAKPMQNVQKACKTRGNHCQILCHYYWLTYKAAATECGDMQRNENTYLLWHPFWNNVLLHGKANMFAASIRNFITIKNELPARVLSISSHLDEQCLACESEKGQSIGCEQSKVQAVWLEH